MPCFDLWEDDPDSVLWQPVASLSRMIAQVRGVLWLRAQRVPDLCDWKLQEPFRAVVDGDAMDVVPRAIPLVVILRAFGISDVHCVAYSHLNNFCRVIHRHCSWAVVYYVLIQARCLQAKRNRAVSIGGKCLSGGSQHVQAANFSHRTFLTPSHSSTPPSHFLTTESSCKAPTV